MKEFARDQIDDKDERILQFMKMFADRAIDHYSLKEIAQVTGRKLPAVSHMRTQAKGSATAWIRLFLFVLNIPIEKLPTPQQRSSCDVIRRSKCDSLDVLIAKLRNLYDEDDLETWFKQLIDSHEPGERKISADKILDHAQR